jgi:hypothetical protein
MSDIHQGNITNLRESPDCGETILRDPNDAGEFGDELACYRDATGIESEIASQDSRLTGKTKPATEPPTPSFQLEQAESPGCEFEPSSGCTEFETSK